MPVDFSKRLAALRAKKREPLLVNGEPWSEGPRYVPPPPAPTPPKPRIFDHLDGTPKHEDRFLSHYARRMRSSEWWRTIVPYRIDECGSVHVRGYDDPSTATLGEVWQGSFLVRRVA